MNAGMKSESLNRRVTRLEAVLETVIPTLATRADVKATVDTAVNTAVNSAANSLRQEMYRLHSETIRWMVGIAITLFITLLGQTFAIINVVRTMVPVAAGAPHHHTEPSEGAKAPARL